MFRSRNGRLTRHSAVAVLLMAVISVSPAFAAPSSPAPAAKEAAAPAPTQLAAEMTINAESAVASSVDFAELDAVAAEAGSVRAIVGLQMRWAPDSLLDGIDRAAQTDTIQARQSGLLDAIAGTSYRVLHRYSYVPYIALELGPDAVAALEASGLAASLQLDVAEPPALSGSIPLINADDAWAAGHEGTGQVVAVLDTGVDSSHPFVSGRVVEEACFSAGGDCPNASTIQLGAGAGVHCTYSGSCDHGTHVAGIAAGFDAGGGSGVARDADIMAVQVFTRFDDPADCGSNPVPCALSWSSDQLAGLERVYALRSTHTFASVNVSIGGGQYFATCDTDSRKAAIDNLLGAGIATVISSGNSGFEDSTGRPGCISTAVTVASSTKADARSAFSNTAPWVDLIAPGSDIYSSVPGGGFSFKNGTSMAAPHVAGAFAVIREAYPSASVASILSALQNTGPLIQVRSGPDEFLPRIDITAAIAGLAAGNDIFANASLETLPASLTGSNEGATTEVGEPLTCDDPQIIGLSPLGATIWYGFTPTSSVPVDISTEGSSFDTVIGVYTGSSVDALTQVACDDDSLESTAASLSFMATGGVTYWLQVGGYGSPGDTGTVNLSIVADPGHMPPSWPPGSVVEFSDILEEEATASWTPADDDLGVTSYGVLVDGLEYGTTTGTTYVISGLSPNATYSVVVEARDANGNATSGPSGFFTTAIDFIDTVGTVFEGDIEWLSGAGITAGCNPPANTMFCPNDPVTRGQMAAFMVRALGLTDDGGGDLFTDDDGTVFEGNIDKLATAGITKGCNPPANTMFCPNDPVTRGQMAAFMVRAFNYIDDGGGNLFTDDDGSVFEANIDKLATAGVTRGCNPPTNDRFCPNDTVTRGQMAAFMHRALG